MIFGQPIQVTGGVFQFRVLGARITVLVENDRAVLVDTGLQGSLLPITGGLKDLGLTLDQIDTVVITHAHPDHCGGLAEVVAGRNIAVAAHRLDADIISGAKTVPNPLQNELLAKAAEPILPKLMGGHVPVDLRLEDGDIIPFGTEVRVVHLPGHTAGSIALHLPAKRVIIVGDALQYKFSRKLTPPSHRVTQDSEEALRSLEKLLDLNFDIICFSHFPPMRKNARAALRTMIQEHAARPVAVR